MKSRVPPKYKTTYRVGNWREYERALVQRGDVILWLSADATDGWRPSPSGRPGGQKRFSDVAIETALVLRLVFGLPVRQTEGFVRSVLALVGADLDAPDHTTLSRRSQQLAVMLRRIPATGPIHLIVDSTGLPIVGQGAWAVATHGVVARIVTGPHDAHRQDPHRPRRYDTGRPRAVIRLRISQPRTTSRPCPAGLLARRPAPMMDL